MSDLSQAQRLRHSEFQQDVLDGLSRPQKTLSCKYLYDETGSALFDQICELDEYYLTRTETSILEQNAESIASQLDREVMLVEPGSGSSIKTQILIDSLIDPVAYVPVDISETHLLKTAENLRTLYPQMEILPVAADFTDRFELPATQRPFSHVVLFFPGSTIGNFEPSEASRLLNSLAGLLGPEGGLLIGIDLQKDISTIEAAYNDSRGITAQFNLNLLERINKELDGDFDLERFAHKAFYDDLHHRIEISLVSLVSQSVSVGGQSFHFDEGEEIRTEYSHKYTVEGFADVAAQHGFVLHRHWTDEDNLFALLHLVLESSPVLESPSNPDSLDPNETSGDP